MCIFENICLQDIAIHSPAHRMNMPLFDRRHHILHLEVFKVENFFFTVVTKKRKYISLKAYLQSSLNSIDNRIGCNQDIHLLLLLDIYPCLFLNLCLLLSIRRYYLDINNDVDQHRKNVFHSIAQIFFQNESLANNNYNNHYCTLHHKPI